MVHKSARGKSKQGAKRAEGQLYSFMAKTKKKKKTKKDKEKDKGRVGEELSA